MEDRPLQILYIDDEPDMLDLVRLILTRKAYEVRGVKNGREGLDSIRQARPDLVLLDLMMPDMDGWTVYQQMKANESTRDIPVIILTAKAQSIDKLLGLQVAKVDDYISKPFSPHELLESIAKVLTRHNLIG